MPSFKIMYSETPNNSLEDFVDMMNRVELDGFGCSDCDPTVKIYFKGGEEMTLALDEE